MLKLKVILLIAIFLINKPCWANTPNEKSIPFTFKDSFIFVDANMSNDTKGTSYSLLFDLGDYRAISLTPKALAKVPHKKLNQFETFQDYKGKTFKSQRFVLPYLAIGELIFQEQVGSEDIHDPTNPSPSPHGAVGSGLFINKTLTIDFAKEKLIISDEFLSSCSKFSPESGAIVSEVYIDGIKSHFIIDTGSQFSLIDSKHLASLDHEKSQKAEVTIKEFTTSDFSVKDLKLKELSLNIPGIDGIIGQDLLKEHQLSIDFTNSCFKFVSD